MLHLVHDRSVPKEIEDLTQLARRGVAEVTGVEPDFTPETLPLVDQYLRQLGPNAAPEVRSLVICSVGCYFGEVLRRALGGRWGGVGDDPESWRVELVHCFLHFSPVGMTGEVLQGAQTEEFDGSFDTLPELREGLELALSQAAPMSEEEFFSLSGRVDVLQVAADWLVSAAIAGGQEARVYGAELYAALLDDQTG